MSNTTNENMGSFLNVITSSDQITYKPLNGFTTVDIGCKRGNNRFASDSTFVNFEQIFETYSPTT